MNEYVVCAECRFIVTAATEAEARKKLSSLDNQEYDYLEVEQITSVELEVD